MARVHKELRRQLAAAAVAARHQPEAAQPPLEAVVQFHAPTLRGLASPEAVQQIANDVLSRVERLTHESPLAYNVFTNLQSMVVQASRNFLVTLLEQPEIASALANRTGMAPGESSGRP